MYLSIVTFSKKAALGAANTKDGKDHLAPLRRSTGRSCLF
nr:MAG TPA: hypothetical protein [Caudoviricetes sp.]